MGHRERIDECRLHEPRHDGDLRQSERNHRQDLVLPGPIVPAADRQNMKRQAKSKLKKRRDNKDRQNNTKERGAIDEARANRPLADRANQSQGRAGEDRGEHGLCAEGQGNWQRRCKKLVHGEVAPMQAWPEITVRETSQIKKKLFKKRPVELIDAAQVFGDFRIERPL